MALLYILDTDRTENTASKVLLLLQADLLPSDGSGIVACLRSRCLAMAVPLTPLF
jgi:hypothetical protein